MSYVKALKQSYVVDEKTGDLVFDDGTRYTLAEALELSRRRAKGRDIRAVHTIKKVFDGEIVIDRIEAQRKSRRLRALKNVKGIGSWEPQTEGVENESDQQTI